MKNSGEWRPTARESNRLTKQSHAHAEPLYISLYRIGDEDVSELSLVPMNSDGGRVTTDGNYRINVRDIDLEIHQEEGVIGFVRWIQMPAFAVSHPTPPPKSLLHDSLYRKRQEQLKALLTKVQDDRESMIKVDPIDDETPASLLQRVRKAKDSIGWLGHVYMRADSVYVGMRLVGKKTKLVV